MNCFRVQHMKPSSPTPGEDFHPAAPAGEEGARTIGSGVYGETRLFPHRHGLLCPGIFLYPQSCPSRDRCYWPKLVPGLPTSR